MKDCIKEDASYFDGFDFENAKPIKPPLIAKSQGIYLNDKEWQNMLEILNNPPEPNEKMKELLRRGKELFGNEFSS